MSQKNRDIRLNGRPSGLPRPGDFELAETSIPCPGPGQVLVRNLYMSVDPYMRGRMGERRTYVEPYQLGETLSGGAVGQVIASSGNGKFAEGDHVLSPNGWREWFVSDGRGLRKVDPSIAPVQAYLGVLGMPGFTAYVGLKRIAEHKPGDRVFVSAAAGAVGSVACQIARNLGSEIVAGSAGSDAKCAWLKDELGVPEVINYRETEDLGGAVADAFPGGIDLYFENVGGAHLEAALANMRDFGRIAVCGLIDQYNSAEPPPGPRNLHLVLERRLTMRGFIVLDHYDMEQRFLEDMRTWIAEGRMKWRETVVNGLERAPEALVGLFQGENVGKMLVRLTDD